MAHSRDLVARIKGGLAAGFGVKQLSAITGIPAETIKQWKSGDTRTEVAADTAVAQDIREALLGRFLGNRE